MTFPQPDGTTRRPGHPHPPSPSLAVMARRVETASAVPSCRSSTLSPFLVFEMSLVEEKVARKSGSGSGSSGVTLLRNTHYFLHARPSLAQNCRLIRCNGVHTVDNNYINAIILHTISLQCLVFSHFIHIYRTHTIFVAIAIVNLLSTFYSASPSSSYPQFVGI